MCLLHTSAYDGFVKPMGSIGKQVETRESEAELC